MLPRYLFTVVFFGLLQIILLAGWCEFKGINFDIFALTKDGGLFFFSTTLASASFMNHFKIFDKVGINEKFWSYAFVLVILAICQLGFLSAITFRKADFVILLNSKHYYAQFGCSFLAVVYGYIAEERTKLFLLTSE